MTGVLIRGQRYTENSDDGSRSWRLPATPDTKRKARDRSSLTAFRESMALLTP